MFDSIMGHQRQKEYFEQIVHEDRYAHAYCFEGIKGIGKFTFAKSLAKYLLCGENEALRAKFESGNHPDILVVAPTGASIKTEQIDEIHGYVHVKPYLSDMKIVIIDESALMTEQAQNKMLKLIEEPPGHAMVILIADNITRLLPTIRSRVIRIAFNPIPDKGILELIEKDNMELDHELVSIAQGSYGKYLKWSTDDVFAKGVRELYQLLCGLLMNKPEKWLPLVPVFENLKNDCDDLLDLILIWLQDVLLLKEGVSSEYLRLGAERESMIQCSKKLSIPCITKSMGAVEEAKVAIKRQQNYILVTEAMLYKIQEAVNG
ncbi:MULTISPECIES: DNA polymerase III subunit delta' C-terminal domain-containing protein [unclassified Fusibacter]|uniref:DNA polymerase III subunit n=1 Tax=unclassified Fusibacter TaxID=2624464 RepID=UPI0013E98983|nr:MULTISPECIES: DNA polymerase III subunit delta' C-terminal domain-containing protein [unclassified Fusibacter]MCK8059216.1 AAA family ATPase [Fusibacter sp. A2]NPE21320.1 AAA family ATPase [Fusibacter sp. A1]